MQEITKRYIEIRNYTEEICKPLQIEDYIPQPVEFVSPPKWNLGHTTWFFEEFVLREYLYEYSPYHQGFAYLFNSYYESAGERIIRANRGALSRPTVEEVYAYRRFVDEKMIDLLEETEDSTLLEVVELGLNHEQQHQELFFTDLKYTLACNPLYPSYNEIALIEDISIEKSFMLDIDEGIYEIGYDGNGFSYDNESGRHRVFLEPYKISNALVTNGEFLEFIGAGGYTNFEYWHSEGWNWVKTNQIYKPLYWHQIEGEWYQYTLAGLRPVLVSNPITHISYYEAAAFAAWKGMRLPTEFEWEAAQSKFDWGNRWEITESAYLPYPGYKKPDGAIGEYNAKFMVSQKVYRGASVVSSPGHSRPSYRNFFYPNMNWQFNSIRLAQ